MTTGEVGEQHIHARAPHRAAETTRPRVSGDGSPAPCWSLGSRPRLVVVATASNVSVDVLGQIHGDGTMLHEVGGTYVAGWISPQWNPFVDGRFRVLTLLVTIVYFTSVTAIGATLVAAIRGAERWPWAVRLLAGFLPGLPDRARRRCRSCSPACRT